METHEFWRDLATGEVWAVELVDGLVAGAAGPLDVEEIDEEFLGGLDYSAEAARRIEASRERFDLYDVAVPF